MHHSESAWLFHWVGNYDDVNCGKMHWWTRGAHCSEEVGLGRAVPIVKPCQIRLCRGAAQTWLTLGHWDCCKFSCRRDWRQR
eukprot:6528569-Ditylum_brightwellii.AAC.1